MVTLRVRPFGDRALLAEVDDLGAVLDLSARLSVARPAGVVDVVPAARSVLVTVDPAVLTLAAARAWVMGSAAGASPAAGDSASTLVELPTVYAGDDLADVAALLGCSTEEVVRRHSTAEWTVAFTGFAPGFGYLVSPDWPHLVPRRASPRTRVPAGAVALAGEFTGAYPRDTPGGWQLIGTTSAPLFDPAAEPPALLQPGAQVRFVPRRARIEAGDAAGRKLPATALAAPAPTAPTPTALTSTAPAPTATPPAVGDAPSLRVIAPGLLATIQDQGRPGHAAEGISPSGAADRGALRTGNRLIGNAEAAAGIEITLGGFRAVALADLWFAVTGAWGPVTVDARRVDPYEAHPWRAGTELHVDAFAHGTRGYLAIRGGIEAQPVAGSRSTDTLARIGPPPLRPGDQLALAADLAGSVPPVDLHPWGPPLDTVELPLAPGPRADWFAPHALDLLFDTVWTVSAEADRVGIRLDGPALPRVVEDELPSEGMVPGAVQVPPSGRPVILGPDGPVTGGYPVIAVVADSARDLLGQVRPGTRVRFRHTR